MILQVSLNGLNLLLHKLGRSHFLYNSYTIAIVRRIISNTLIEIETVQIH